MKKTSLVISSVSAIALSLTGCGGGGSSSASTQTGTGSYVDSAVKGAKYICGSQTGTTDKDGNFTFEKGKGCTFELAGITLRKVPADNLVDNSKIVENNLTVARFLQSIDNDGNATNGIQITKETLTALNQAFQEENITIVPDDTTKLDTVVNHIEANDDYFHGHVVTEEDAQNHLHSTQKSVTKNLLAGKTFYAIGYGSDGVHSAGSVEFNKEFTKMHYKGIWNDPSDDEIDSIKIEGNKIIWLSDNSYTIVGVNKGDYIEFTDYSSDGSLDSTVPTRIYFNKTKAETYFKSLKSGQNTNSLSAESLKAYFSGKTFYEKCDGNVSKMIFNSDGTTLQDDSRKWDISFEDGKIVDNDGDHFIDKITDTYVKGHDEAGSFTMYVSKSDAEAAANKSCGDNDRDNNSKKVSDLISGDINFVDQNGTSLSTPSNAWVRITPKENQVEGDWNGVNCKIDANGNFGSECYVHTDVDSMRKYFNSDYNNTYQFVAYIEKTGDTHFEKEEEDFGELNVTDPSAIDYGDWKNATVVVNNP